MRAQLLLLLAVVVIEARRRRFPHTAHYSTASNSEPAPTTTTVTTPSTTTTAQRRTAPKNTHTTTTSAGPNHGWYTRWFETRLDNFDLTNLNTFNLKYLVNTSSYKEGGPIFFYTGNEGPIEEFARATGLMFDLAPAFGAAVIFCEHRYYGDSQPYGNESESYKSAETLAYLTSEQALADYAALLGWLKNGEKSSNDKPGSFDGKTKVIAFGGSYGGMLSAWFRMKYPHVVDGAYASSAPVLYFNNGGPDWGGFDKITTETFRKSGCDNIVISKSWDAIRRLASTADGRAYLNQVFNVDKSSTVDSPADADGLIDYIREGIEYMAMTDYSYPTNFLKDMPASPVKYACNNYLPAGSGKADDKDIANAMAGIASVYYNYHNQDYKACFKDGCEDAATDALGSPLGWPWQECTEIPMTMCAKGGQNDFFWNECATDPIQTMKNDCQAMFKSRGWKEGMLGVDAVQNEYGFSWKSVTNIIMTQGELDPWRAGGLKTYDKKRRLFATTITNSAHHFDLRQPNTCDPSNLTWIRFQAVNALWCFIDANKCTADLDILDDKPSNMPTDTSNCKDIFSDYPWKEEDKAAVAIFSFTTVLVVIAAVLGM